MTTNATSELLALGRRWVDAELHGDAETLADISIGDLVLVGPVGFVLDREQWLARFGEGGLTLTALQWDVQSTRVYGDAAVLVGVQTQEATFRGNPANGSFRLTQVVVREGDRWLLAGLHLSPIGGPPPFATPDVTP